MTQNEIDKILDLPKNQKIINSEEFYFLKGRESFQKWMKLEISESVRNQLIQVCEDYQRFKELAENNTEFKLVKDHIFEIISYCDNNANGKNEYNQYEDKRVLADASVRMGNWVSRLIKYKLYPSDTKLGSIKNAIDYLLDPQNNTTILSENHREAISNNLLLKEYEPSKFTSQLKDYFAQFNLSVKNKENYTEILSILIYSFDKEWKNEVIGLMASDGTQWQNEFLEKMVGYDASVIWNSKRPSGTNKTIKYLKNIINEGESFPLFYSSGGIVKYKADIIDIAESQEDLDKKQWDKNYKVLFYNKRFSEYFDENKVARIIFLCKTLYKIDPISVSDFEFYDGYDAPRQDNLSPIKEIPSYSILNKMNYKNEYVKWLNTINPNDSGTKSSYIRAIEILSSIVKYDIFEENNIVKIDLLYQDLLKEQKVEGGKYYHKDASSYGIKGFYSAAIKTYSDFLKQINTSNKMPKTYPLNMILFGPPGTGKTYNSINRALEIINDDEVNNINWKDRKDVKRVFDKKIQEGQIVFTTFHQSMSYEDFIEGIKPLKPKVDDTFIKYDIVPGVFMSLCERATSNYENSKSANNLRLSFESAFEKLKEEWEENPEIKFPLKTEGFEFTIIGFTETSIQFKKASGGTNHTLSINKLRELYYGKEYDFNAGIGIYYPGVLKKLYQYSDKQSNELSFLETSKSSNNKLVKLKNYVIVIDEINRGNVSQIFGELITLIEEDKRLGRPEALEVTLPYSKTKFGVPPNLFLIGTMNTADRSVEALDTALRRRFVFEETPPKYDLQELQYSYADVKGYEILYTINNRIEKLLDKDHVIGHSYFILKDGENVNEKLMNSFYKNIIPLLQEYFFGDFGKIGLVLGQGFVNLKFWGNINSFAEFDHESISEFENKDVYEIVDYRGNTDYKVNNVKMDFEKAIKSLMKLRIV